MNFESVTETLKRLEAEIADLRAEITAKRAEETEAKRRGDQLRAEARDPQRPPQLARGAHPRAQLLHRHRSQALPLELLRRRPRIRSARSPTSSKSTTSTKSVVDEFLRDELNYIVVKSWDAANEGMRLLKTDVDGRATFLVHPEDAQAKFSFAGRRALPASYRAAAKASSG